MSIRYPSALLVVILGLLAGCGSDQVAVVGISVEVYDAATGAPAAYHATLIVRDGEYADTVRGWEAYGFPRELDPEVSVVLSAAEDRPGVYEVTVIHPDYEVWRREGVRVRSDGGISPFDGSSLVKPVRLRADLIPRVDP